MASEDERTEDERADGEAPTEEVGPDGCNATATETDIRAGELDAPVHESEHRVADEIAEAFPIEKIPMGIDPTDGMPVALDEVSLSLAAPFSIDTVVCVEDEREFVEMWADETRNMAFPEAAFQADVSPAVPGRGSMARRERYNSMGAERTRASFPPSRVERYWGLWFVRLNAEEIAALEDGEPRPAMTPIISWLRVRPRRERCIHYRRQIFANDDVPDPTQPGHRIIFRNCAARRSVGGALLSLRDEAVYACDYREPSDPESTALFLDVPDKRKLETEPHKIRLPLFGVG